MPYKYSNEITIEDIDKMTVKLSELNIKCFFLQYQQVYKGKIKLYKTIELDRMKEPVKGQLMTLEQSYFCLSSILYQIEFNYIKKPSKDDLLTYEFFTEMHNTLAHAITYIRADNEQNRVYF